MPKTPDPTADVIAQAIAECLKARREELDWSATDVQEHGGPTYHTVLKTEAGKLPKFALLERHITALGLSLKEVLAAAVAPPGRDVPLFSRDASEVARIFDQAGPSGQAALREMARVLDLAGRRRRLALTHPMHRRAL